MTHEQTALVDGYVLWRTEAVTAVRVDGPHCFIHLRLMCECVCVSPSLSLNLVNK